MYVLTEANGTTHELVRPLTTLGRSGCDIVFADDEKVSRHHAQIIISADRLEVRDLGSTNGVTVNGARTREITPLSIGDVIQVGGTTLTLRWVEDAPPTVAMPSMAPPPAPPTQPGHQPPPPPAHAGIGRPVGPTQYAPSHQPPIQPYSAQPGAPAPTVAPPKSRDVCIILEVVPGIFGILGIGWIYAGNPAVGVPILIGCLVAGFFALLLGIFSFGCALLAYAPILLVAIGLSAFFLYRYTQGHPERFI